MNPLHQAFPLFIASRLNAKEGGPFSVQISRIAIGTIAVGLATLLLSFFIFEGFRQEIQQKIFSHTAHLQVRKFDMNQSPEGSPISLNNLLYQGDNAPLAGIAHVQAVAYKAGLLKTEEEVMGVLLKGIGADYRYDQFEKSMVAGELPQYGPDSLQYHMVISEYIANKLRLQLADEVILYFVQQPPRVRKMKVAGIYNTGMEEFDQALIMGDINLVRKLNNWPDSVAGQLEVYLEDFRQLEPVADEVYDVLPLDLMLSKVTDEYLQYFEWFAMLNQNVFIFLIITLFVVAFNVTSVMLILIMERTRMVGTLKALGASTWQIQQIFVARGFRLTLWGLLWGNAIGLGLGVLQKYFKLIPLDPENYYMNAVPIGWNIEALLGVNLLILVIVVLIMLLPTLVIARIAPVKSIKFA